MAVSTPAYTWRGNPVIPVSNAALMFAGAIQPEGGMILGGGAAARVIGKTLSKQGAKDLINFTSDEVLSSSDLLDAGETFLGKGYKEVGREEAA
jgi:hypothetical protein